MPNRRLAILVAPLLALAVQLPLAHAADTTQPAPEAGGPDALWRNPAKSPAQRAADLLPRLTLQEKIALLHADGTFTSAGVPRLNIPKLWMSDGPGGVREEIQPTTWNSANRNDDFATALPANIGLAASFDTNLAAAFGHVIGEEALARKKNIMLCPGLNIMRTPLNGRNSEYFGEDPYLASRMAVGFINALQSHGVAACAKHFALNNQEDNRGTVNVHIDERTMREIYLPAFKAAVTEAHVWSVMTAYNRVNGQYCSENEFLLNQVLKKEWAFPGLVMTDWSGCHSTVAAANNGLDLEMGSNVGGNHDRDFFAAPLLAAVNAGQVPQSKIDEMALRNLTVMAATGNLDPADKRPKAPALMSPEHIEAARKIQESACVLLKNDHDALPLDDTKIKTIAVIGQNADTKFAHDGNSAAIKTKYEITPLAGITTRAGDKIKITYSQGYAGASRGGGQRGLGGAVNGGAAGGNASTDLINAAVAAAKNADVAIVVAGLYRAQDQEGKDRPDMNLPPGQSELIQAVTKANPRTIVILTGGSPSNLDPWLPDASALLMDWYGGTEGGNALAHILFGDVNPSGHLPCSWPKKLADSPAHNPADWNIFPGTGNGGGAARGGPANAATTGPQETYAEGLLVGYRWFDTKNIEPQFPFGFGLSYTTFKLSDLTLTPAADGQLTVQATLTNTGPRKGAQVVQLYVSPTKPALDRPTKELKAFTKSTLPAGGHTTITLKLDPSSFAYFDPTQHAWIAQAGDYTIYAGDSSRNLPLKATFTLPTTITIKEGQ